MSGICGYIDYKRTFKSHALEDMVLSMSHQGSDGIGMMIFDTTDAIVAMGHTSLSTTVLSKTIENAHQPMTFDGLTITLDGEIYNFKEIRRELKNKGHTFVTASDYEVVLHAFREWKQECVDRFIGMFAFAIYDEAEHALYLCRDRAGIKPLYYYLGIDFFAFASELKAFMALPQFKRDISLEALSTFLKTFSISGELSIFENTFKLNGGYWAKYQIETKKIVTIQYWNIEDYYARPKLKLSYNDAKEELKSLIKSALNYQLVSNVPVGGFLSSGFDSSLLNAILSKEIGITPKAFTIGFESGINEIPAATKIADILGVQHYTRYCKDDIAKDLISQIPQIYDEPFADPSAIPSLLASKLAKEHVEVVLSADGNDQQFAGFDWYSDQISIYQKINNTYKWAYKVPYIFFTIARKILPANKVIERAHIDIMQGIYKEKAFSYKVLNDNQKLKYQGLLNDVFPAISKYSCRRMFYNIGTEIVSSPEYALLSDFKFRMKDEYLVKMERATKAMSLECREPMLDHRISEFAAQLPWEYKYQRGAKKRIIRDIVYDYLPKDLMNQPKRGFAPPIRQWMRGCLKTMIYDELTASNLKDMGFSASRTLKLLNFFMEGGEQANYISRPIWSIFQYWLWYDYWIKGKA